MGSVQGIFWVFSHRIKAKLVGIAFVVAACVMAIAVGGSLAQVPEYKLGAGDKVRVVVLADPEFSGD